MKPQFDTQAIETKTQQLLGGEHHVRYSAVEKENGQQFHGFTITQSDNETVGTVLYLEDLEESILEGESSDIAKALADLYRTADTNPPPQCMDTFYWNYTKHHLTLRLFDKDWNCSFLKDTIVREFHGLVAVPYTVNRLDDGRMQLCKITKALLKHWNISADTVFDTAMETMQKNDPPVFMAIETMLGLPPILDFCGMYVLTNESRFYGSTVILYPGVLERIHKEIGDFYLLPSSAHEMLVVNKLDIPPDQLKAMVQEINRTVVAPSDRLSDGVWFYNGAVLEER